MDFIPPHSALFNASYQEAPFTNPTIRVAFQSALQIIAQVLGVNAKGSGAHLADDLLVWFRNLGFTEDPDFCRAMEPYLEDKVLRARIWRVYALCWAAKSAMNLPGHFVDIGCYDGKTIDVMRRFIRYEKLEKDWVLYDLFDYHPTERSKQFHGPELYGKVCAMFADTPRIKVVKGFLPQSMTGTLPDLIAFAQIDLNSAAVEIDCLKIVLERMTPGGMIVLDDYGFKRYHESYASQKKLAESMGQVIFESPTGQGILIKR
ncbi:MAG TPA: TylF/MycF/NovP-related O-methyltransferase [Candidatus Cybelea sp.]|nr:TylF/MycF/NovP-related O-methyltransferase [Candidatus Cybelea sp.]